MCRGLAFFALYLLYNRDVVGNPSTAHLGSSFGIKQSMVVHAIWKTACFLSLIPNHHSRLM